jgi:pantoate--beta-alanine ligase
MSSRNTLLTPEERHAAKLIPKLMQEAKIKAETKIEGLKEIEQHLLEKVKTEPLLKPDYIMFCDAETLQPVSDLKNKKVVCLAAIFSGRIRLIDNILIN